MKGWPAWIPASQRSVVRSDDSQGPAPQERMQRTDIRRYVCNEPSQRSNGRPQHAIRVPNSTSYS